jgi:hypothetical protein
MSTKTFVDDEIFFKKKPYVPSRHWAETPVEVSDSEHGHDPKWCPSCSGGICFDTIGTFQVPVSDSGWAQIGGSYTVGATETAGRETERRYVLGFADDDTWLDGFPVARTDYPLPFNMGL